VLSCDFRRQFLVYQARFVRSGAAVAIKFCSVAFSSARPASLPDLVHPHLVPYLGYLELHFVACERRLCAAVITPFMPYNLQEYYQHFGVCAALLDQYCEQVLSGLAFLEVHFPKFGVSPHNIFLAEDGLFKLGDYGLDSLLVLQNKRGLYPTLTFCRYRPAYSYDRATPFFSLYSFAAVFVELFTLAVPYPELSSNEVLSKCLARTLPALAWPALVPPKYAPVALCLSFDPAACPRLAFLQAHFAGF